MAEIPKYDDWINSTAEFGARRNDYLKALGEAIKDYHLKGGGDAALNRVDANLNAYIKDHDTRKGKGSWKESIRNKNKALENLQKAITMLNSLRLAAKQALIQQELAEKAALKSLLAARAEADREEAANQKWLDAHRYVPPPRVRRIVSKEFDELIGAMNKSKSNRFTEVAVSITEVASFSRDPWKYDKDGNRTARTLRPQKTVDVLVPGGSNVIHLIKSNWSNAKTDLVTEFIKSVNARLSNMHSIQLAATEAYGDYTRLFKVQAEATKDKISLVTKFFDAMKDYAPWPVSVIGKVGETICGQLHVDEEIQQGRRAGDKQYFDRNLPLLDSASKKFSEISNWKQELTRVGVSAAQLSSSQSISDQIEAAKARAVEALVKVFQEAANQTYGGSVEQMADKSTEFYKRVVESNPKATPNELNHFALRKISRLSQETIEAFNNMGELTVVVEAADIKPFIELNLYAELMAVAAPPNCDLDDVSLPEGLVEILEHKDFQLLTRKTDSGQSAAIYASGKLPWAGDRRHKAAIVLFFRWYALQINPFDIAVGRKKPGELREEMTARIRKIGVAVQARKIENTFSKDATDWTNVNRDLAT